MAPYVNKLKLFANSAHGEFIKIHLNPCSDGMKIGNRTLADLCEKSWPQLSLLFTDTAGKPSLDVTHPAQSRAWSWFVAGFGADAHRTTEGFAWEGP